MPTPLSRRSRWELLAVTAMRLDAWTVAVGLASAAIRTPVPD